MKRGICRHAGGIYRCSGRVRILGISSGKRDAESCAREDPVSLHYLKLALKEAEKHGAETQLIDLRDLRIGACKECYSTCPSQCRFNKKTFQCDCYPFKEDVVLSKGRVLTLEAAQKQFGNKFIDTYNSGFVERDDMWIVYKAMLEADGIIFATATNYYSRPALMQAMFSRLCAIDGGVEELWGDGKNLNNSIKYAKSNATYNQRLYGKLCAFINCSKEGDSVTPDMMKACVMMGMKVIPLGCAYRVNWYYEPTHRSDTPNSKKDSYTLHLLKHIGHEIVSEAKKSNRKYGIRMSTV